MTFSAAAKSQVSEIDQSNEGRIPLARFYVAGYRASPPHMIYIFSGIFPPEISVVSQIDNKKISFSSEGTLTP